MQRHLLGITALLLIFLGATLYLMDSDDNRTEMASGMSVRIGVVMASLWLAWPQLVVLRAKVPTWLLWAIVGILLTICVRPKLLPVVVIAIIALVALHLLGKMLGLFGK